MDNQQSLLNLSTVDIIPNLSVRIPTVGEILDNEFSYYSIISSLTASPFQYMVPLDDMGMDYTTMSDYSLFQMLFPIYAQSDLSILFGNLNTSGFTLYVDQENENRPVIYNPKNGIIIDEFVYNDLADTIRKINLLEKVTSKPGNESARKYLLKRERRKQLRSTKKKQEPYLEKLIIALVNTTEFPYDYDSCMNLSIYRFNQSLRQIQHKIAFDNTMMGVYAGTIDASKLSSKDCLTWIPLYRE